MDFQLMSSGGIFKYRYITYEHLYQLDKYNVDPKFDASEK